MIALQNFTKRFGETTAVRDVTFDVNDGEVFGLIGPDGAGKTTTLRVISTAMAPTAGRVTVGEIDVTRDPEAVKKMIGYMPQRFALYPDLTVLENLNFFADVFGSPRENRAALIERLLGFARLTDFQTRLARNLSGGMQKKLALAATLMHRPRVLLLDEPTTGVDPVSRREFWDLLTEVRLQGRAISPIEERSPGKTDPEGESTRKVTIVITTPYLDEAERCTRVGLMFRGEMIACDTPGKLRADIGAVVLEVQSDHALAARRAIEAREGVLAVSMHGDLLRLLVDRAERQAELEATWTANGVAAQNLRVVKPRLEDAFVLMLQKSANSGQ